MTPESAGRVLSDLVGGESDSADTQSGAFPVLPGYTIEDRIGCGGGGEVFRAIGKGSIRPVALKILNHRLGRSHEAKRAWRELEVLEQLHLPCIPRLVDSGVYEGRLYLATDFIDGCGLVEHCRRAGLDREARVALLAEVADAVHMLHEHGVIHRDIKPSNILIDSHGSVVLIDLGIAGLLGRNLEETLTREGVPIGSPAYMAPEQARGERDAISTRSDVYGLGATAYLVLTGSTPHGTDATVHEAIRRVAHDPPRPPRELDSTLPKPLAAVLSKATAQEPGKRYASAAEMAADLRRWLNREPVIAGGLSPAQRIGQVVGRHPVLATVALCSLIAVVSIFSTNLAVRAMANRPHYIRIDPHEHAWATLESVNGNPLHRWDTGHLDGIVLAELVDLPQSMGGGREVVVVFRQECKYSPGGGRLCFFDLDNLDDPYWRSPYRTEALGMPRPISNVNTGEFTVVNVAKMADVFPDRPGDEIIVVHRHVPSSPVLIRVYGLDREVLYEVWHDGYVESVYWMSGPRLLVAVGYNSEAGWDRRGYDHCDYENSPWVVMAIRPEADTPPHHDWIRTPGGRGTVDPQWYRCVMPPQAVDRLRAEGVRITLSRPSNGYDSTHYVKLDIGAPYGHKPGLGFIIDQHGHAVPGSLIVSDGYDRTPGLPDPEEVGLDDLPPILPAGQSRGTEPTEDE